LWFCFTGSCGGSDIYGFVANIFDMDIENNFKDIVRKTAEILHVDIANLEFGERTNQQAKELRQWIEFVSKKKVIVNPFFDLSKLGETRQLNSYRHFTKDTIEYFNASYNVSMNRIQVPLYNANGECIGASLRRVEESEEHK
jgi:hypothetical protein